MLSASSALICLCIFSFVFSVVGYWHARNTSNNLDDFICARNTQSSNAILLTMLATTMGTWVLFGPAETAVWGGVGAVFGYALGTIAPNLFIMAFGKRMRELVPNGRGLSEFIFHRFGLGTYIFIMAIMFVFLIISLIAGLTAIAQMVAIIAPIPLWQTVLIVLVFTLIYTIPGGLKVSIFTDRIQTAIILPFIALMLYLGWEYVDGISNLVERVQLNAPSLLDPFDMNGLKTGVVFFLAVALTGLFYQATWQRVYSANSTKAMMNGLLISALFTLPIVFCMGFFGLAYVALGIDGEASVALFTIVLNDAPSWLLIGMILFGLALIMSSADSTISGINSLLVVEINRMFSHWSPRRILSVSQGIIVVIGIISFFFASQGYSILYLFLLADLFCCAAAFPIFFGLYNKHYKSSYANLSISAGIVVGLFYFPLPGEDADTLFESFLLASAVPILLSIILLCIPNRTAFDFSLIKSKVNDLEKSNN